MRPLADTTDKDGNFLAQYLNPLTAVVIALVDEDGKLLQANKGCCRLLDVANDDLPLGIDMRGFFIHPSFAQLTGMHAEVGHPIHEGIINVGSAYTACRSLIGAVHRRGRQLLLVGEYDVIEMERLNAQVIELNQELAETQRGLARANRELQQNEARLTALSLTDPLTGLANRRRLMEFLKNEIERNRRYGEHFSIIMTDLDFFKKVNDGFGHDVGDEVLQAFSRLLDINTRSIDLVARLGGEEFIIVMPNTSLDESLTKAEQLRAETELLHFDSMQRGITASFGVAGFLSGDDANSLLKHVDEAAYASKHGGRNRVTTYVASTSKTKLN